MKCYECQWLDRSIVLASFPPKYRCTLGFGSHYADHECEYDFMPIVRCKDCISFYTELCTETGSPVEPNDYCSYGKRRE